jgi:hypothetical protein
MKDIDKQKKFIELRGKNWSLQRIADEIKVNKSTLIKWNKDFKYEVSNVHHLELEALYEQHKMTTEHQIKYLGELQEKLLTELKNRDLTDVKSDKILDMLVKTIEQLENLQPEIQPTFRTEDEIEYQKDRDRNPLLAVSF